MPEAVIFAAAEAIEFAALNYGVEAGAVAFVEGTTFAISNVTLIQGGLTIAASIGLAALTAKSQTPTPEEGTQSIRQAIPPRQRGYWINRLAGAVMLYTSTDGISAYQVNAFHQGRVEAVTRIYLDDISVNTTPDYNLSDGFGAFTVIHAGAAIFTGTTLEITRGLASQTPPSGFASTFRGDGVAYLTMGCYRPPDPTQFQNRFPRGLPRPSLLVKCALIFDPRDDTQTLSDDTTWKASPNPVLQLLDYLTLEDGGCGYDRDEIFPADVLAAWMTEADLCDPDLGGGDIRYQSAGWYKFDNSHEAVINHVLSTCDGWMADAGDGTLALTVGVYREPTEPALEESYILDCILNYGMADESAVNQLDVSITDPAQDYAEAQIDSVRDETAISETGIVRAQQLDLTWVQARPQATRLAQRALLRLNPRRSGTLTTTLYGLRYLGKRWVKLQYPSVSDLADCVIEIQGADVDLLGGTVTFTWILVDPVALSALQ